MASNHADLVLYATIPWVIREPTSFYRHASRFVVFVHFFRSEKLQNESSPNFSNFCPEFCPEFCSELSPKFSRIFSASFRGKRRPEKFHQKSPPFFNAKFPGKHEKKNIHKNFLESRQSNIFVFALFPAFSRALKGLEGLKGYPFGAAEEATPLCSLLWQGGVVSLCHHIPPFLCQQKCFVDSGWTSAQSSGRKFLPQTSKTVTSLN